MLYPYPNAQSDDDLSDNEEALIDTDVELSDSESDKEVDLIHEQYQDTGEELVRYEPHNPLFIDVNNLYPPNPYEVDWGAMYYHYTPDLPRNPFMNRYHMTLPNFNDFVDTTNMRWTNNLIEFEITLNRHTIDYNNAYIHIPMRIESDRPMTENERQTLLTNNMSSSVSFRFV